MDETYPGTDMLIRICYDADCQKRITELDDLWVDIDSNCCVCTNCRNKAGESGHYVTEHEFLVSILPAKVVMVDMINGLEEG